MTAFLKQKIFLASVLMGIAVLALRQALRVALHFEGLFDFSDVVPIATGATFLSGFMLNAIMADFKESEKIPTELAAALEVLEDLLRMVEAKGLDATAHLRRLFALTDAIVDWFIAGRPIAEVNSTFQALAAEGNVIAGALGAGAFPFYLNLYAVRRHVRRADVMRRTRNLPAGYLLMDLLALCTILLTFLSRFKSQSSATVLIAFTSITFSYLLLLTRDMDDPFEYQQGRALGGAEVDLMPLCEYRERARERLPAGGQPRQGLAVG